MTGPEHYREAERLQRHAAELAGSFEGARAASEAERDHRAAVLADAQVHATLALAAALGLSAHLDAAETRAWREGSSYPTDALTAARSRRPIA